MKTGRSTAAGHSVCHLYTGYSGEKMETNYISNSRECLTVCNDENSLDRLREHGVEHKLGGEEACDAYKHEM